MEVLFIIGRILLGGFFIYNAVGHFMRVNMMSGYAKSKGVPAAKFSVIFTGLMLLVGGLSIVLNMYAIIGIWILIAFLVVTTAMMHPFWKEKDPSVRMNEQIGFMKNLALIGALLMMVS